jgi:hypothetical protein
MTVGTKKVHHRIFRDFMLVIDGKTAIEAGQPEPSMFKIEGGGHADRWIAIDVVLPIHQAMIAAGTTYLHRKDALIRGNVDSVQTDGSLIDNFFYLILRDV